MTKLTICRPEGCTNIDDTKYVWDVYMDIEGIYNEQHKQIRCSEGEIEKKLMDLFYGKTITSVEVYKAGVKVENLSREI